MTASIVAVVVTLAGMTDGADMALAYLLLGGLLLALVVLGPRMAPARAAHDRELARRHEWPPFVVLGAVAAPLEAGQPVEVRIGDGELDFAADGHPHHTVSAHEIVSLEVSGPGATITGGGFFGGGFGLDGFLVGAAAAGALNAVTTKTTIRTLLRVTTQTGEMTLATGAPTPEQLDVRIAGLRTAVRLAGH